LFILLESPLSSGTILGAGYHLLTWIQGFSATDEEKLKKTRKRTLQEIYRICSNRIGLYSTDLMAS